MGFNLVVMAIFLLIAPILKILQLEDAGSGAH